MSVESIHGEVTSESSSVNMTPSAELMITSDLTDISHVEVWNKTSYVN